MSEQYFTHRPTSDQQRSLIETEVLNHLLKFYTDHGVFSRGRIDYGSRTLIDTFATAMHQQLDEGVDVLELGSGYGPIVISLEKAYPNSYFWGIEVNERAYQLSVANAMLNHCDHLNFILGDVTHLILDTSKEYDHVLTNPPIRAGKEVIQSFVRKAQEVLKVEGSLWVVIQRKQGAPSMERYMESLFGNVERVQRDKGYYVLRSVKMTTK